jgi:hypothetical protein
VRGHSGWYVDACSKPIANCRAYSGADGGTNPYAKADALSDADPGGMCAGDR